MISTNSEETFSQIFDLKNPLEEDQPKTNQKASFQWGKINKRR